MQFFQLSNNDRIVLELSTESPQNAVHWSESVYQKKHRERMRTIEGAAST